MAVVGTAASAIQIIPEVAADAAEVHVYQRTPNWFMPTPDYHRVTDEETLEMHRAAPRVRAFGTGSGCSGG